MMPTPAAAALSRIDHVVIGSTRLDEAAAALAALGFRVTPASGHPSLGTRNRTVVLPGLYLEWLHAPQSPADPADYRHLLRRLPGVSGFALRTTSAAEEAARRGLTSRAFSRPLSPDQPGSPEARFETTFLPIEPHARFFAFFCQHHTPELVWRADYAVHPNGITGVKGIDGGFRAPADVAAALQRQVGGAPGNLRRVATGETEAFDRVCLGARQPGELRDRARAAGFSCEEGEDGRIRLLTARALGVDLVIEEAEEAPL